MVMVMKVIASGWHFQRALREQGIESQWEPSALLPLESPASVYVEPGRELCRWGAG